MKFDQKWVEKWGLRARRPSPSPFCALGAPQELDQKTAKNATFASKSWPKIRPPRARPSPSPSPSPSSFCDLEPAPKPGQNSRNSSNLTHFWDKNRPVLVQPAARKYPLQAFFFFFFGSAAVQRFDPKTLQKVFPKAKIESGPGGTLLFQKSSQKRPFWLNPWSQILVRLDRKK